jgi:LPXTG-motif cell wall-anchored protein
MCEYFLHTTSMGGIMKNLFIPLALLLALSVPALAQDNQGQDNNDQGGGGHGAPGPLMGAGLPVLLIGGGIYWIVRRKKRS